MAVNNRGEVSWKGQSEVFGKVQLDDSNQIVMNLRFPGQYHDSETGTYYNYFRDYNPTLGRYQQRDPIGLNGGVNLYGYAYNNPLYYIDPRGEFGLAGAIYGGISGAVGGHITGGWKGAIAGGALGFLVGFAMPAIAGSIGNAVVTSLLGQGAGNYRAGKDITDPCNYDFWAAAGAGLGTWGGRAAGNFAGKYIGPIRFNIIGRPLSAPGISKAPSDTFGAIGEGIGAGIGESLGQKLKAQLKLPQ